MRLSGWGRSCCLFGAGWGGAGCIWKDEEQGWLFAMMWIAFLMRRSRMGCENTGTCVSFGSWCVFT